MKHIVIPGLDNCLGSSMTLPLEMLNAANSLARARNRVQPRLQVDIAALHEQQFIISGALTITTNCRLQDIEDCQLIILPALWRNPMLALGKYPQLIDWLQKMAQTGSWICAVGTSCCFLAEAGLLDQKPATTHWYYLKEFAQRYPLVEWKDQYLITQADNIYCAGSVNSVADLMIHLVGRAYGQSIAKAVEAQFSPEIRRPFENHAYSQYDTNIHNDEEIIRAQEWLREHATDAIQIQQLADRLGMSARSFNRRFKQAVGLTPGEYLHNQRMDIGKELLRTTNLTIAEVAEQTGYHDSSYFCARFKRWLGQTPLAYRKSVRGKLFKVT
jgi:transcriptional regulator GlxA family with amidase domain